MKANLYTGPLRTTSALLITTAVFFSKALAAPTSTGTERMNQPMQDTITTSSTKPMIDSLELVGVGVSIETYRNHPDYPKLNLWAAVERSNGAYVISQEARDYPADVASLRMVSAKRKEDAVSAAMSDFVDRYPLPIAVVGPALRGATDETAQMSHRRANASSFVATTSGTPYTSRGTYGGLHTQSGQVMTSYLNDEPDTLWQTVFGTFAEHGDIPAIGVAAKDGVLQRSGVHYMRNRSLFDTMVTDAYRPKQARTLSDNWTFITLVRRGRVDWLRPLAPLVADTMVVKNRNGDYSRNWSESAGWKKAPPTPFVPTPYIATPWTSFQIDQFDHLQNLGTLYRPQVVSYRDAHGKPVTAAERAIRMEAALRAALAPLKGKMPARILYDYGSVWDDRTSAARFLPLVQSVQKIDPEYDLLAPKKGYDLARILGDTGAGSPFVAVALASMASRQSGGPTLVANLRRNDGATLLLVTPPSAEQVKKDALVERPYFPSTVGVKDSLR